MIFIRCLIGLAMGILRGYYGPKKRKKMFSYYSINILLHKNQRIIIFCVRILHISCRVLPWIRHLRLHKYYKIHHIAVAFRINCKLQLFRISIFDCKIAKQERIIDKSILTRRSE